eukprot:5783663-Prymnesium_polylepis.2
MGSSSSASLELVLGGCPRMLRTLRLPSSLPLDASCPPSVQVILRRCQGKQAAATNTSKSP